ncbi:fumarylacetoacetate hydrolase family protein [Pusillimonas sp.]|uniref:fumarylacetoacetate hydrolase family protein n=1 Tax=Pusillimonas sp. TaxID=3040095 RepID=UPI0037CA3785
MKLATFCLPAFPEKPVVGVVNDCRLHPIEVTSMKVLLSRGPDALAALSAAGCRELGDGYRVEDVIFQPPIPDAGKLLCVGKNYRAHLEELKRTDLIREMPSEPTGFIKINESFIGHDASVVRPPTVSRLDYEPELVFVIGRPAYQVKPDDALSYVAGITLLNDLTCRDTQKREVASGTRFWTAKNAPGFGPMGPYIITMDEVRDPYDIWVSCRVNGELRMRVNTNEQIWRLARIIEHFSRLVPLMPGDMISTGAPGGVAVGSADSETLFLKPGDVVECAFENPEMTLRNHIVEG